MTDVFVSYAREDGGFVRELHDFLTAAGRDVWVDWEDIPAASEWERDINDSIDGAESFVFVVSPTRSPPSTARPSSGTPRSGASGSSRSPATPPTRRPPSRACGS